MKLLIASILVAISYAQTVINGYEVLDNFQCGDASTGDCHPVISEGSYSWNEAEAMCSADENCVAFEIYPGTLQNDRDTRGSVWLCHHADGNCAWGGGSMFIKQEEESEYQDVLVVDVGVGTTDINTIRSYCPAGRRLVSLVDAGHIQYLKEALQNQKGDSYFTSAQGTALGYMYNNDHIVYDLNDPTRDLSSIFADAMNEGIIDVNEAASDSGGDQPWAGFGWGDSEQIHDYSTHTTRAVFCEMIPEDTYKNVVVVDVGVGTTDINTIRSYCSRIGRQLVSLQDADHIEYLKQELLSQRDNSYFTSAQGTPLGYMYNNDHRVYDLNDPTRDLSSIFADAMAKGIIDVNEADPAHSADQPWAGFGWGDTEQIHDYSTHTTKAVFCEPMDETPYPRVDVIDVGQGTTDLEVVRRYCTSRGQQLVSLQDVGHIQYLKEQLQIQKGDSYFTSAQGTALGYMYNNDHRVYDLNDPSRDLSDIFAAAMNEGVITLNEADPSHSADQPWAGFGWGGPGEIHDYSTHTTRAVFCEDVYPMVLVIDVGFGTADIEEVRAVCTQRNQELVSLQDAGHIAWLQTQLMTQKGNSYFTSGQGTALGYMYNNDHIVYDLNDPTRDLSSIFADAMNQGIIDVNEAAADSGGDQPWAGFGWGDSMEIHDYSTHITRAVFCQDMPEEEGYPSVRVIDAGISTTSLDDVRQICTDVGMNLVSLRDAEHIQYLKEEIHAQKGDSYFNSAQGTPLGYMYNNDHVVYDLNDNTRELSSIFEEAMSQGIITYNEAHDGVGGDQPWAGFGWGGDTEIHDWSTHTTRAVICEVNDDIRLMEECSTNTDSVPMSLVTGEQSSIEGDSVTVHIDYPGYMTLESLQWVGADGNINTDSWTMTSTDLCQNPNSISQTMSYASLENSADIGRTGQYAEFSLMATFSYYTESDITGSAERIVEQKQIKMGIMAPTTHVVSVTSNFQPGMSLLHDITNHGIIEDGGNQVVYITFRTFLSGGHTFNSDCAVTSPYFVSATCTVAADNEDFTHPEEGAGTIQTWTIRAQNSDQCIDGEHSERIDVDLTMDSTGVTERIQFMVDMKDEVGPDCRVILGEFDLSSTVLMGDAEEMVDPATSDKLFYLNSVINFQVSFDSAMLPTYVTLEEMTISQNNQPKCGEDCFEVAEFVCTACDAMRKSPGEMYEFSVVLTQANFEGTAGVDTATSFDLTFGLQYTDRRMLKKVEVHKVSSTFSLRDYDCKGPNGLLSSLEKQDCGVIGMSKTMMCSSDGWTQVSECVAPGQKYLNFGFALIATLAVIALLIIKCGANAVAETKGYKAVSVELA